MEQELLVNPQSEIRDPQLEKKEAAMSDRDRGQRGITVVGVLVVVVILIGLAFLLWPTFKRLTQGSLEAICTNNLRQIGVCLGEYEQDNQGVVPPAQSCAEGSSQVVLWNQALEKYLLRHGGESLLHCPAKSLTTIGYAVNYRVFGYGVPGIPQPKLVTADKVRSPRETIYALDTGIITEDTKSLEDPLKWKEEIKDRDGRPLDAPVLCRCTKDKLWDQYPWRPMPRHNGKVNCLMLEGNVEALSVEEILKSREGVR